MASKEKGTDPTMNTETVADPKAKAGRLGRDVQARIGQQLRAMYDDVVEEGVPDRFAELLKRLDANPGTGGQEKS